MSITRYAGSTLKSAALWAALAFAVLFLVLAAFVLLATALFIYLDNHLGAADAAALTALALLFIAALIFITGSIILRSRRRHTPDIFGEASGTIAMLTSLANILIRRDPKRAILFSLLAGAITEYFTRVE